MTIAEEINAHLENGGVAQVTTYLKSTLYTKKNAGWFTMVGKNLYVKHGKGKNCLSIGDHFMVGIRLGTYC
jgi:hypothetical protein